MGIDIPVFQLFSDECCNFLKSSCSFFTAYLTMHLQDDPSRSSCSSTQSRTFWSWSSWNQYRSPSLSRPIGCMRICSGSSSFTAVLNLRLSSNWLSHKYCKTDAQSHPRAMQGTTYGPVTVTMHQCIILVCVWGDTVVQWFSSIQHSGYCTCNP